MVERCSCGLGPVGGLGLIVSREDDAEPESRIPGRGAGTAGLVGSGLGAGSGEERGSGLTGGFRGGGCLAALDGGEDAVRARGA